MNNELNQAEFECSAIESVIANAVDSWNQQLAHSNNPLRFELYLDFNDTGNSSSDGIKVNSIIVVDSFLKTGVVKLVSFKKHSANRKKTLIEYTHNFSPSNIKTGQFTDIDFLRCKITLYKKLCVEAFGTYLTTLDNLVKG